MALRQDWRVRSFEELVSEADATDVSGWGFEWLEGRATEERPPWGYARLLATRLGAVGSALDIDTGGGEVVDEAPVFPPRMVVTEAWPHVGPASARELIEHFRGPLGDHQDGREPEVEVGQAEAAGLVVENLRTARCRMEFRDIGTIVWILRKCVWWVPDFSVERYLTTLLRLDAQMRAGRPVVAHSTRHLVTARR